MASRPPEESSPSKPKAESHDQAPQTETAGAAGEQQTAADLPQQPGTWQPPPEFGRYQIHKRLGAGAMGSVYLGEDSVFKQFVALKFPHFDENADGGLIERFYREARAARSLRHTNICPVYDVGEHEGRHYLAMAYVDGDLLSKRLHGGHLPDAKAAEICEKLARALQVAHDVGIVHRDLKPSNIMLEGDDPVIMDFGLALLGEAEKSRLTQTGQIVGTPAYMPPEQVMGDLDEIGPHSDVYSLGVILYEMLTGERPFTGPIQAVLGQVLHAEPPSPRQFRADIDPELETICLTAMAKEIRERYRTATQFADALNRWLGGGSGGGRTEQQTDASFGGTQYVGDVPDTVIENSARDALQKGQCAACLRFNQPELDRCVYCSAPLYESCTQCSHRSGVWDEFCQSCGTDKLLGLDSVREEFAKLKREIPGLRKQYRQREAIDRLKNLATGIHYHRLTAEEKWRQEMLAELEKEWETIDRRRQRLRSQAMRCRAEGDYDNARRLLSNIHNYARSEQDSAALAEINQIQERQARLTREINAAASRKAWNGLLPKVEELLQINPQDALALKLKRQLGGRGSRREKQPRATEGDSPQKKKPGIFRSNIVLTSLIGGGLVILLCCGGGYGLMMIGFNSIESEIRDELQTHPVLVENVGTVYEFEMDMTATLSAPANIHVFDVVGSNGRGELTVESHTGWDDGKEVVTGAKLRLSDGRTVDLMQPE